jgi:hypothetical protein
MFDFEVRCGMTKWEFDLRMRVSTLRKDAAKLREAAESHYRWAQCCPSIEYMAWMGAGDEAMRLADDKERQAKGLETKANFFKLTVPYVVN